VSILGSFIPGVLLLFTSLGGVHHAALIDILAYHEQRCFPVFAPIGSDIPHTYLIRGSLLQA